METMVRVKQYEAMFLVDSAAAASDWDGVNSVIKKILERAGAEILSIKKWDERKLAYDIKGVSRGTYILCYIKAPADKIHQIEREVQISEKIMRVLILKADHITAEDMEKPTPAMQPAERGDEEQAQRAGESAEVVRYEEPQRDIDKDEEHDQVSDESDQEQEDLEK